MTLDLEKRPFLRSELFALNRKKILDYIHKTIKEGAIVVEGLPEPGRPRCDYEPIFRQDSNFYYITGVNLPDCEVYIDIATGKTVLFYPVIDPGMAIWAGPLPTLEDIKNKYKLDDVILITEKDDFIKKQNPATILDWKNETLLIAFEECRQTKSENEVEILDYNAAINNLAYRNVLNNLKPGMFEFEVESYMQRIYFGHCCLASPFQITVCSGELCSILHYHKKTRQIQDGDLVLIDAGGEYEMFCSDNTRTFPANGKFTEDQRAVYTAVLDAQKAVIESAKPGVSWQEMALLSARTMAAGLVKCGLLKGAIEDIIKSGALAVFYPHGLGHGMGLDVHEIGGWPRGQRRPDEPHIAPLRLGRVLEPGMAVTVEPGCYFIEMLYEEALRDHGRAKHIDADICRRLQKTVGGVRIEDDILITEGGCRNLSVAIPKEIDEIEALMAARNA